LVKKHSEYITVQPY